MIGLYKGRSWLSALIRWRTWDDYTHASIILREDHGPCPPAFRVVEAWGREGVVERPDLDTGHTPGTIIDVFRVIGTTSTDEVKVFERAQTQVGKKYDWRGVLKFITRRSGNDQNRWFCSELVSWAYRSYIPLFPRAPDYKVYPGLLSYCPLLIFAGRYIVGKGWQYK